MTLVSASRAKVNGGERFFSRLPMDERLLTKKLGQMRWKAKNKRENSINRNFSSHQKNFSHQIIKTLSGTLASCMMMQIISASKSSLASPPCECVDTERLGGRLRMRLPLSYESSTHEINLTNLERKGAHSFAFLSLAEVRSSARENARGTVIWQRQQACDDDKKV